jgi:hypothetical protein
LRTKDRAEGGPGLGFVKESKVSKKKGERKRDERKKFEEVKFQMRLKEASISFPGF